MPIARIISGGQTGVDRAALDVALLLSIPCGGWCPRGRLAEDGAIEPRYPLYEAPTGEYALRTEWNVRDADGTLVLAHGETDAGTALTVGFARQYRKPFLVIDLTRLQDPRPAVQWAREHGVRILNVAGPRASQAPGIYDDATGFLMRVLELLKR